jgi:hypothetical protein
MHNLYSVSWIKIAVLKISNKANFNKNKDMKFVASILWAIKLCFKQQKIPSKTNEDITLIILKLYSLISF